MAERISRRRWRSRGGERIRGVADEEGGVAGEDETREVEEKRGGASGTDEGGKVREEKQQQKIMENDNCKWRKE
jgi:hypothetical protein